MSATAASATTLVALLLGATLACGGPAPSGGEEGSSPEPPAPAASRTWTLEGLTLHGLVGGPEDGPGVLLLHGMRFDASTWAELGTLDRLAEEGFRVVALDLPGLGDSEAGPVDAETFLARVIPALGLTHPVVVAPSMSGRFAFPLVAAHPDLVSGFVPIAPAGIREYVGRYQGSAVPTLIVWGERDTVVSPSEARFLQDHLAAAGLVVLPGASHPCYLDAPDDFHRALIAFLRDLPR